MPSLPVTANLLAGVESDMAGAIWQDQTGNTTPATANGDSVRCWIPLAAGNSLGNFASAAPVLFHVDEFGAGLPGIRGNASGILQATTNPPALTALDVFMVIKTLGVASSNNDRLVSNGPVATAFNILLASGTTTTITGGVMEGSTPFGGVLASADATKHVVHLSRISTARRFEIDGHTVNDVGVVTASATTAAILALLSATSGSPCSASMACFYLYNKAGGLSSTEVNQVLNYLGTKYSITLAGVGSSGWHGARPTLNPMNPLIGLR